MSRRLAMMSVILAGFWFPGAARADAPFRFPWQESSQERRIRVESEAQARRNFVAVDRVVPFVVEVDETVKDARLLVPRHLLAGLRKEVGQPTQARIGSEELPTLAAGVSLSLAFVFAGLRLTRWRKTLSGRQAGLLLALVVLAGVGGTVLWANAQAPQPAIYTVGPGGPTVSVQLVEQGESIKLQVNRAVLIWFAHLDQDKVPSQTKK